MAELLAGDAHETGGEVRLPTLGKRGRPFGSPELDWVAAEEVLASAQTGSSPVRNRARSKPGTV